MGLAFKREFYCISITRQTIMHHGGTLYEDVYPPYNVPSTQLLICVISSVPGLPDYHDTTQASIWDVYLC